MPIVKVTRKMAEKALAATDWATIDAMTDEEIARQVAENPDAAPLDWIDRPAAQLALLRRRLAMTQKEFAQAFHIKLRTLRAIEQGQRTPSGTTLTLLKIIAREPEAARRALAKP